MQDAMLKQITETLTEIQCQLKERDSSMGDSDIQKLKRVEEIRKLMSNGPQLTEQKAAKLPTSH